MSQFECCALLLILELPITDALGRSGTPGFSDDLGCQAWGWMGSRTCSAPQLKKLVAFDMFFVAWRLLNLISSI